MSAIQIVLKLMRIRNRWVDAPWSRSLRSVAEYNALCRELGLPEIFPEVKP